MTARDTAAEILRQLGGARFIMMTGAKNLCSHPDERGALSMRIGRNSKSVNYVKVTLTQDDLYTMEFGYIRGHKYKVRATIGGLYFDRLQDTFQERTGLHTRL